MWLGYRNFLLFRFWVGAGTTYNALFRFQLFIFHYVWLANKFYIVLDRRSVNASGTSINLGRSSNLLRLNRNRVNRWDWILVSLCKIIIVEISLRLGKVKGLSNTLEGNNAVKE